MSTLLAKRHKARRFAVQALYQWQLTGTNLNHIETDFTLSPDLMKVDFAYFQNLLHNVPKQLTALNKAIERAGYRAIEEITPVEKAILWIGAYEILYCIDIPKKVAISEALKLAKAYGTETGYKYINAILDKIAL